jgi:hypothetical protein
MGKLPIGFCIGVIGLKGELHSQHEFCRWRKLQIDLASTCSMSAGKVQASSLPRKKLLPFNDLYANCVNQGQVARLQQVNGGKMWRWMVLYHTQRVGGGERTAEITSMVLYNIVRPHTMNNDTSLTRCYARDTKS